MNETVETSIFNSETTNFIAEADYIKTALSRMRYQT